MADTAQIKELLERIKPLHVAIGMSVLSLIIMLWVSFTLLEVEGPLPPPRPAPPRIEKSAVTSYRFKEGFLKALVHEDAGKLGLPKSAAARLFLGNPEAVEFTGRQRLRVGSKLETEHLAVQAAQSRTWVGEQGQGFRSAHLVLRITNKTDSYLAYRVDTDVRGACGEKGAIPHNAMALKPKETVQRSECLMRAGPALTVRRVEVMEISGVGYFYVSRLNPVQINISSRTAEGHEIPGRLRPCALLPWRAIQVGMRDREVSWRDVIDFYSRHSCDEYTFFVGYRYDTKPPARLPVIPPKNG